MGFIGRVAIILVLTTAAAAVHSLYTPIYRDVADMRSRAPRTPPPQQAESGQTVAPPTSEQAPELERDPVAADPVPAPDPVRDPGTEPVEELPDYYISVDRAFGYWEEGMAFVDARTDAERVVGTVEGAFHLETRNFIDGSAMGILDNMEPAFPVIVFCGGGECDASENVAKRLIGWGFNEVYIMHEGFGAWEAAGHPTEAVGGG
jgi:rhodanese-related sulfurtransferase